MKEFEVYTVISPGETFIYFSDSPARKRNEFERGIYKDEDVKTYLCKVVAIREVK